MIQLRGICRMLSSDTPRVVCRVFGVSGVAAVLVFLYVPTAFGQGIHLQAVRVPNQLSHWSKSGFVEMVPPLRLPTNKSHTERIMVWLRIPAGETVAVKWLPDQKRYTLQFPPGTVADRIDGTETGQDGKFKIDDVRGAKIGARGKIWWHVYRPVPGESSKWLRGYKWLRTNDWGDMLAADSLVRRYFPGPPAKNKFQWAMQKMMFRMNGHCSACHQVNRPIRTTATKSGSLILETDGDGFFQPITVLTDTMTEVNVRPWGLNADDPYITVRCGKHKAKLTAKDDSFRRYTCPNHIVPTGKLDMMAALNHMDPHALKVCAARKYLYKHMSADGRNAFSRYFAECSIH